MLQRFFQIWIEIIINGKANNLTMKYKHVFLIWFWADLILAIVTGIVALFVGDRSSTFFSGDISMFFLEIAFGVYVSLPSLAVLLLLYYFYNKNSLLKKDYFKIYAILILCINLVYAMFSYGVFTMKREFGLFYIFSTVAGLLALYLVDLKIKKEERNRALV
jgi:hypothetical protein